MVASLWEIVEFSIDRLFDSDMQKDTIIYEINSVKLSNDSKTIVSKRIESTNFDSFIINGYLDIGLYDTIEDMICAVIGSVLCLCIMKKKKLLN